jgi:hypothetical protein
MKKAMPFLGAAIATLAMAWSAPANAQDSFKDVPQDHWAYQAVTDLQKAGVLLGYPPEGFYKGRRYLTRYEFAVALKRAWDKLMGESGNSRIGPPGPAGPAGPVGENGAPGPKGDPGMTPDEVATLRRLTDEFKNELAAHGANIREIMARLDAIQKDVNELKKIVNGLPKISIAAVTALRSDTSRSAFVDRGGAFRTPSKFGSNVNVLHDVHLNLESKLGNDAKFTGDLVFSNYLGYRGNNLSANFALNTASGFVGTPETIMPYQAQIDLPVNGFGQGTTLTLGRYKHHGTALTYSRPDTDPYFYISAYDDGNYVQDGFRLSTKFGSLKTQIYGASFATVTDNLGNFTNRPFVGGGVITNGAIVGNARAGKIVGLNAIGNASVANQAFGIRLGLPLAKIGQLGITAALFGTSTAPGVPNASNPFNTVALYGADLKLNDIGRLQVGAEVAKTVTSANLNGDGQNNEDNNAYRLNLGYNTGALKLGAGYNYIDPRYGAPGAWMTIGNWYNPTNVQGPYVKVGYKLSDNIGLNLNADYLKGARNRSGYLGIGDSVARVRAGVDYKLSSRINLMFDYEGVLYGLSGAADGTSASGLRSNPVEQYLTIGAGVKINPAATWKLGYQMINFQNVGGGFGAGNGLGVGTGTTSNAVVFTSSLAVKF